MQQSLGSVSVLKLQWVMNFYFPNSADLKTRKCGPESLNRLKVSAAVAHTLRGALSGRVTTSLTCGAGSTLSSGFHGTNESDPDESN